MKRERSGFTWSYLNSNSPERMGASKRHCVQTSHLGNAATGTPSEDVAFLEKGRLMSSSSLTGAAFNCLTCEPRT
jgi:hypothetical protein